MTYQLPLPAIPVSGPYTDSGIEYINDMAETSINQPISNPCNIGIWTPPPNESEISCAINAIRPSGATEPGCLLDDVVSSEGDT